MFIRRESHAMLRDLIKYMQHKSVGGVFFCTNNPLTFSEFDLAYWFMIGGSASILEKFTDEELEDFIECNPELFVYIGVNSNDVPQIEAALHDEVLELLGDSKPTGLRQYVDIRELSPTKTSGGQP